MKINQNKFLMIVLFLGIINVIFSEEPTSINVGNFKEVQPETKVLGITAGAITTDGAIITTNSSINITSGAAVDVTSGASIKIEAKEEKAEKYILDDYVTVEGTEQKGQATYYAKKFHGKKTNNGEKFSIYKYTGAHRTLKFGTLVKVTNVDNGKSVIVKINDRGPFSKGKIIDLSPIAFEELAKLNKGILNVKIEVVKEKTKIPVTEQKKITEEEGKLQNADVLLKANNETLNESIKENSEKKEEISTNEVKSSK